MLSHWAADACMASHISWKRATARAQNAFHSPVDKDGSAQKAIIGKVLYTPFPQGRSHLECRHFWYAVKHRLISPRRSKVLTKTA
ncbi:hypothetical protein ANAPC5_01401 [Anaplasma phagocytophilum]|nr:hypothetical protein ANAPC5_01401 [Anaplasma phagocytophilum]